VLLRLAYLAVTNALAMVRLLPMSDRVKDAEILALRHQITILERQLQGEKVRSPLLIGCSSPLCCTGSLATCCAGSGWSCAQKPCAAGTGT
jgi:hypothetical protein